MPFVCFKKHCLTPEQEEVSKNCHKFQQKVVGSYPVMDTYNNHTSKIEQQKQRLVQNRVRLNLYYLCIHDVVESRKRLCTLQCYGIQPPIVNAKLPVPIFFFTRSTGELQTLPASSISFLSSNSGTCFFTSASFSEPS